MSEFLPKLLAVDLSANYVEYRDTLYVTTRWQNAGTAPLSNTGKVAVDFLFDFNQRHGENQTDGFRITWTPAPELHQWQPGDVWSTTGRWEVPKTWCGTFWLHISLLDDSGAPIPFIGRSGQPVIREEITDIDLGWGWGRVMLEKLRHPVHVQLHNEPDAPAAAAAGETVSLGDWQLCAAYPALCGVDSRVWRATEPVITLRDKVTARRLLCQATGTAPRYTLEHADSERVVYTADGVFGTLEITVYRPGSALCITAAVRQESDRYEVIDVTLPRLLCAGESATLINFFGGGRAFTVGESLPLHATFPYDVCNTVALADGDGFAVLADDMESFLHQSVLQGSTGKEGVIGATIRLKVPSESPGVASIPLPTEPIEIHPLEEGSWQALARFMRARLPEGKTGLYDNTLFYKISADKTSEINKDNPETWSVPITFAQIKEIIRAIHHVTNGMRQVVYLVGWQQNGHDTKYPFPHRYDFSPRVGTAAEWEDARQFAKEHNTILSFHDNFDDVYEFEGLNQSWVATDCRGRIKKGWLWGGGMSYILSPKAYVQSGEMAERVRITMEKYGIEDSYHLDVLTSEVRRYDFSAANRSAAKENVEYKKQIIAAFNAYGVDITSESLAMPFVGHIGYALHTRYDFGNVLFPGERVLPLTTMMYHGIVPYNMGAVGQTEQLRAIAYGANCGLDCIGTDLDERHIRSLYLHAMPMHRLANKLVSECRCEGDCVHTQYGADSYTEVDFAAGTYTIVADGVRIGWNNNAWLPTDKPGTYLAFSQAGETLSVPFVDGQRVTVAPLSYAGIGEAVEVAAKDGTLTLALQPDVPVVITTIE